VANHLPCKDLFPVSSRLATRVSAKVSGAISGIICDVSRAREEDVLFRIQECLIVAITEPRLQESICLTFECLCVLVTTIVSEVCPFFDQTCPYG